MPKEPSRSRSSGADGAQAEPLRALAGLLGRLAARKERAAKAGYETRDRIVEPTPGYSDARP